MQTKKNDIKQSCGKERRRCLYTKYIMDQRKKLYRRGLFSVDLSGVIIPASLGYIVVSDLITQKIAAILFIILGSMQFVLSLFSISLGWNAKLSHATESSLDNDSLYEGFSNILEAVSTTGRITKDIAEKYKELILRNNNRTSLDSQYNINLRHKRNACRLANISIEYDCPYFHKPANEVSSKDCKKCKKIQGG